MAFSSQRKTMQIFGYPVSSERELITALEMARERGFINPSQLDTLYRQYVDIFREQDRYSGAGYAGMNAQVAPYDSRQTQWYYDQGAAPRDIWEQKDREERLLRSEKEKKERERVVQKKKKLNDLIAYYYNKNGNTNLQR